MPTGTTAIEQEIFTHRFTGNPPSVDTQHANNLDDLDQHDDVTFEPALVWARP